MLLDLSMTKNHLLYIEVSLKVLAISFSICKSMQSPKKSSSIGFYIIFGSFEFDSKTWEQVIKPTLYFRKSNFR